MAIVRLRNVNPLGHVDLPLIGRQGPIEDACLDAPADPCCCRPGAGCLKPGEEFEVDTDLAVGLLEQVGNYEPVTKPGEEFEVDTDLADGLLEQVGNYEPVTKPATEKGE